MAKTEEDWFLRGGKRPDATGAHGNPDARDGEPPEDEPGKVCQNCGVENLAENDHCVCCGTALTGGCPTDEYCDDDDGNGELKTYIVTMSRTKSVQQTAEVRVKAHSEEEALDLIEDRAEDEAEIWAWKDNACTEEYDDVEAVEAEVAE